MRVISADSGVAWCEGRGEQRRVRTVLIGEVVAGEWLLVFLDSATERLLVGRAAEINATLDLLAVALDGNTTTTAAAFELPSSMTTEQLQQLAGTAG